MVCATRCPASAAQNAAVATSTSAGRSSDEPPRRLGQRQAQTLDVDVAVGQSLRDGLEAADRPVELLAFARVLGGEFKRALEDTELKRGAAQRAQGAQPSDDLFAADNAIGVNLGALQLEVPDAAVSGGVQRRSPTPPASSAATRKTLLPESVSAGTRNASATGP